ncbi:MAG: MBL fold metallo-hydrolase [Gammaproteobacteria bacterium]|nr:MBL fold metallo-hydrolase [Gammaproteobacteria bacterium]
MTTPCKAFFDPGTFTYTYVVYDREGGTAAIIDPVLNYDHKSGRTSEGSNAAVTAFVQEMKLKVDWILETHAHADHLSGAVGLKQALGGKVGIGSHITTVQETFKGLFNLEPALAVDGSQFDHLFTDGEAFDIGGLKARALYVPGHTPACMAYQVEEMIFVGDTLFVPDVGTARCDFPGGDARTLYRSIRRILDLPADTRIMVCHDYPPGGREVRHETSVAEQRADNIHVHDGISEEAFVGMRTARDQTLDMPLLIIPSIQVNIRAGKLPPAEDNGRVYLKIPVNLL